MTKDDFYRLARENAKKRITEFCYGIECTTCPFKSPDCTTKAFYELLEENYELKEKLKNVREKKPIYKLTQFEYDLITTILENCEVIGDD